MRAALLANETPEERAEREERIFAEEEAKRWAKEFQERREREIQRNRYRPGRH
jgi:hypothetical protein